MSLLTAPPRDQHANEQSHMDAAHWDEVTHVTGDVTGSDLGWSSSGLTLDALADRVAGEAGRINAATCAWLGLVAEAHRRTAWNGFTSTASWLSWLCGIAPGTAREHVRVARALEVMPLVRVAFSSGRMSYSQVRAVTRVAGIIAEATLIDLASWATGAQLERLLRALIRATRAEEDRAIAQRRARWWIDEEGCLVIRARIAGPDAALVMAALDHAREAEAAVRRGGVEGWDRGLDGDLDREAAVDVDRDAALDMDRDLNVAVAEDPSARGADALVALARAYADPQHRASATGALAEDPVEVYVVVEAGELAAALDVPAGTRDLDVPAGTRDLDVPAGTQSVPPRIEPTGVPISRELLLALTCHTPTRVLSRFADGSLVDLGRTRRAPSRAIARSVLQRHGGACAFPACHTRRHLHLHHVVHWAHGGTTSIANLVPLCGRHHRSLHHGDFRIEPGPVLSFTSADGVTIPPLGTARLGSSGTGQTPLAQDHALAAADRAGRGITATPGRDTSRLDLGYATWVLLEQQPPHRPVIIRPT